MVRSHVQSSGMILQPDDDDYNYDIDLVLAELRSRAENSERSLQSYCHDDDSGSEDIDLVLHKLRGGIARRRRRVADRTNGRSAAASRVTAVRAWSQRIGRQVLTLSTSSSKTSSTGLPGLYQQFQKEPLPPAAPCLTESSSPFYSTKSRTGTLGKKKKSSKARLPLLKHLKGHQVHWGSAEGGTGTKPSPGANDCLDPPCNVVQWLERACPVDVVAVVLAFCGPQKTVALSRLNHQWYDMIETREGTWRILCEELYKWNPSDPVPASWREHYRTHPCVPVDFSTIQGALACTATDSVAAVLPLKPNHANRNHNKKKRHHEGEDHRLSTEVTVLLRPGIKYELDDAIKIVTVDTNTRITIETCQNLPCQTSFHDNNTSDSLVSPVATASTSFLRTSHEQNVDPPHRRNSGSPTVPCRPIRRAVLVSHGNRRYFNEPLIRILRGELVLKHVALSHRSLGVNIWNGNAAILVQPDNEGSGDDDDKNPGDNEKEEPAIARCRLQECEIRSRSGRGIVCLASARCALDRSCVHDCAASGIYVGGAKASCHLRQSDVVFNGTGHRNSNTDNSRGTRSSDGGDGIARGHSGIYVESGALEVQDSNVSHNIGSGISVIHDHGMPRLRLRHSDVTGNGRAPIGEQRRVAGRGPPPAVIARGGAAAGAPAVTAELLFTDKRSGNRIAALGTSRPRSAFLRQRQQHL